MRLGGRDARALRSADAYADRGLLRQLATDLRRRGQRAGGSSQKTQGSGELRSLLRYLRSSLKVARILF